MRTIDADALYEQLQKNEELARKRVLDTESCLPYPNNLNTSYTRYVAQMDERTRLKHMVADAPTIKPERKTGKWIGKYPVTSICSECGYLIPDSKVKVFAFCPNCGSDNREDEP